MKASWKKSALALSSLLWVASTVAAINMICMVWLGEAKSLESSILRQIEKNELWNMATKPLAAYKLTAYKIFKPEIVAIGSSRSLQFRDYYFNRSFYNAGGTVLAPSQFRSYYAELAKIHVPKVILYPLDFWLFCDDRFANEAGGFSGSSPLGDSMIRFPMQAIKKDLLSARDYLNLIQKIGSSMNSLGFIAATHRVGFGPDGSIYNFRLLTTEAQRYPNLRWQEVESRIQKAENQFLDSCASPDATIAYIGDIRSELAAQNVQLLFMAPPMPFHILMLMKGTGRYGYVDQWRQAMKKRFPDFIDLHDPSRYKAQKCEFTDGFHAGEVATVRSLLQGAADDEFLRDLLNLSLLESMVEEHGGATVVARNGLGRNFANILAKQTSQDTRCLEAI